MCARYGRGDGSVIGVRVAGRVVADIHRELGLPVPGDQALYEAMLPHVPKAAFALDRVGFLAFLESALSQCLEGKPLVDDAVSSATDNQQEADTDVMSHKPTGLISVTVRKMNGVSVDIIIDDSATTEGLSDSIEACLGVPKCTQRLLLDKELLTPGCPLFQQGVNQAAVVTLVSCKPQATLLRIRRVNIGDTSVPIKTGAEAKKESTLRRKGKKVGAPDDRNDSVDATSQSKVKRAVLPDVRMRPVNLGRI